MADDKNMISEDEYASMVFEEGGSLVVDMSNVAEQKYELIKKGIYNAEVDQLDFGLSKSSGAPMFTFLFRITDGEFENRKLYFYASFSPKAMSGTKTTLMRIAPDIFGERFVPETVANSGMVLGRRVRIKVTHEAYEGEQRARVQTVLTPMDGAAAGGEGGGFFG